MPKTIIDCHTHAYPIQLKAESKGLHFTHKEPYWSGLMAGRPGHSSLQDWPSKEEFISAMETSGIARSILQGWYWESQETCHSHNLWIAEWVKQHPQKLSFFATVQPLAGMRALEELKQAHALGAIGIGEICHSVQGFSMKHPLWLAIVEWAIEHHLPILMHVTEPVGKDYWGRRETPLADFVWLAKTYPALKLILAHCGGLLPLYAWNPALQNTLANIYYDTAGLPLLYKPQVLRALTDAVGPSQLLFGSDYPLKLYPKIQTKAECGTFIKAIEAYSGLTSEEKMAYFSGNAKTIFQL